MSGSERPGQAIAGQCEGVRTGGPKERLGKKSRFMSGQALHPCDQWTFGADGTKRGCFHVPKLYIDIKESVIVSAKDRGVGWALPGGRI